jgi:hypothetical protein
MHHVFAGVRLHGPRQSGIRFRPLVQGLEIDRPAIGPRTQADLGRPKIRLKYRFKLPPEIADHFKFRATETG